MTDRNLLETILQKISGMDSRITDIETNMATKDDLAEVKDELTWSLPEGMDADKLNAENLDRIREERVRAEEIRERMEKLWK